MVRKRFHSLKKPKIRADWSRETLYNLSRQTELRTHSKTFYQQKWEAKAMTRAYHGYSVAEQKWEIMFDRRLPAVVPMSLRYLARNDGSEQSAGRGSGLTPGADNETEPKDDGRLEQEVLFQTPYMQMTYWPIERRLDTAIWRALFASSALQARQFVVHGHVKVNGRPMRHPSYLLNPGDMFSVDPESVMYATGARKFDKTKPYTKQGDASDESEPQNIPRIKKIVTAEENLKEEDVQDGLTEFEATENEEVLAADPREALKTIMAKARSILDDPSEKAKLSGKKKQDLRSFKRQVRATLSKIRKNSTETTVEGESVEETVEGLQATLAKLTGEDVSESTLKESNKSDNAQINPVRDAKLLRDALDLVEDSDNSSAQSSSLGKVEDASKAYSTPWQPRQFMSAFAFIPRFLEVNHKICSAVYLRHPVARPGMVEVPSPFSEETYALAHNWYLRRR